MDERRRAAYRQSMLAGIAALGLVAVFLSGAVDDRLSLETLPVEVLAQIERAEGRVFAGSNIEALIEEVSWGSLAAAAPAALTVALFRPFPWEASGVLGLLAAVENGVLLALCGRAAWLLLVRGDVFQGAARSALFWTSVVFVGVFGLAVGVTQPNLGTVSRYRVPLLPFVVAALVVVEDGARGRAQRERAVAEAVLRSGQVHQR